MSERNTMAVVSDLIRSGLTVEQQILVNELVMLVAELQSRAEQRREWKEKKRLSRECLGLSEDKRKEPKENNITLPIKTGEEGPGGNPVSRDNNTNPRALGTNPRPSRGPWEPGFECFWNQYPLKKAKGAARKAYLNALKRASAEEIEAGARRYAATKPEPAYTKHPATWLNADCWLDEDSRKVIDFRMPAPRSYAEIKAEREAKEKSQ
jgi:hypothetical protein